MPNKKQPESVHPKVEDLKVRFDEFGIAPEKHAEFKEAMLTAAHAAAEELPKQIETIKELLRRIYPPDMLAAFTCYGLQAGLKNNGEQRKLLADVQQNHAELLQGLLLSLAPDEWGGEPLQSNVLQILFDTIPKLSDAFLMQRILEGEAIQEDEEATVIRTLQERIRLHTFGVRNWGYYQQVIALSRDLYASLDAGMLGHYGFGATDFIDTLAAIVVEFEKRQSNHWDVLRKVLRGKTPQQMVKLYYQFAPGLTGNADEMLASLPPNITRDQLKIMLIGHSDLRLMDTSLFRAAEIAALTGKPEEMVSAILKAFSYKPGSLSDTKPAFLFLDNPVWDRPAISLGDTYFCAMPQIGFSHIHRLMDRLAGEANLKSALKDRRALYLEQQLEAVFRQALPDADIRPAVKWKKDGQQFENDLLVIIDRVVIIAEAKSHRLTPAGLRGAPDRVKRHIRDIVYEASVQSARLEELIRAARAGDMEATQILASIRIDASKANRVIRLSVTLDDLSILSTCEQEFKKAGWVPQDHELAPSLLISDLRCVAEILDNPLLFLHYLSERAHLQKAHNLLGDELDFLGLYLETGFNLDALQDQFAQFSPTGMSAPIDRYYIGREAGLKLSKPKMNLRPLFRDIIERLCLNKSPGWTLIGFDLLSSADPAQQKAIEGNLIRLRRFVQKNYRDPNHISTCVIQPPGPRKGLVMFYLFPRALHDTHPVVMERLASNALDSGDRKTAIIFGRCTEQWGQAFETAMMLDRT